jgi:putative addiction module component (TIGR02574 family)
MSRPSVRRIQLDKRTKKVMDAALGLPYADRSALLNRLMMVLGEGPEIAALEATLALPESGRWQVVEALFGAVDDAEEERLAKEWEAELARRDHEAESGQARTYTWTEVQEALRKRSRADL